MDKKTVQKKQEGKEVGLSSCVLSPFKLEPMLKAFFCKYSFRRLFFFTCNLALQARQLISKILTRQETRGTSLMLPAANWGNLW